MAIFNHGIFSKAKNKLGGVTFQQYEGMQIGKEYQPNVKNPNAPAQIATRTRFSLASKTVALLYPWLSPVMKANGIDYERFQRGNTLKKLMAAITYDDAEDFAVMSNFPALRPNSPTHVFGLSITMESTDLIVTITSDTVEANTPFFIACVLFPSNGNAPSVIKSSGTMTGQNATVNISLPSGFQGSIETLCYGAIPTEETSGVSYGEIVGANSAEIATLSNDIDLRTIVAITNLAQRTHWHA